MDPTLIGLLSAIDMGDVDAIGMLADWLEERGDARSIPVRQATLPQPRAIALTLMQLRHGDELGPLMGYVEPEWDWLWEEIEPSLQPLWENCVAEVEQALVARKLSNEVARAIRMTRRAKIDELLTLFKETPSPT